MPEKTNIMICKHCGAEIVVEPDGECYCDGPAQDCDDPDDFAYTYSDEYGDCNVCIKLEKTICLKCGHVNDFRSIVRGE